MCDSRRVVASRRVGILLCLFLVAALVEIVSAQGHGLPPRASDANKKPAGGTAVLVPTTPP